MRIVRGLDVGETHLTPRAATCSFSVDELLNVETGAVASRHGAGRDGALHRHRARRVELLRSADEHPLLARLLRRRISRIVGAGSGFSSGYMAGVSVGSAMQSVLDAIGMQSAEYDLAASARALALYYIAPDRDAWQQLLTLLRTAGPRSRLYESADGVLTFRDLAVMPAPVATLHGRRSGITTAP